MASLGVSDKRILVIGSPGAGKTTFSKRLAQETGLPLFHMDHMLWLPGWVEREETSYLAALNDVLSKDAWIIDGNHLRALPERLARAELVYFLDINRWRATYRVIKRRLMREGLQAEGCPQRVDLAFIKFVFWTFPRRDKQRIMTLLEQHKDQLDVHII
tara:strand:+ start:136229 stop:136705 length:477 start_codon:yes stop_codon:yes gene_type:complete